MRRYVQVLCSAFFTWMIGTGHAQAAGFSQTLALQGVQIQVSSTNKGSINKLRIHFFRGIARKQTYTQEIFGTVTGAEIADLNADGWPEIYVYLTSAGTGSHGSVVGYAVNNGKSATPITMRELAGNDAALQGYMGHDTFAVMESGLARRIPVYASGDSNATPSGVIRQMHYRLAPGEAGWLLVRDPSATVEFQK